MYFYILQRNLNKIVKMERRLQNLHMKFNFQFVFSIGIHKYIQTWMLNVWIALHNKLCCRNTAKWDDAQKCNNTIITIFFKISCTGTTRERAKQKFCLKVRHLFFCTIPVRKLIMASSKRMGELLLPLRKLYILFLRSFAPTSPPIIYQ